MNSLRRGGSEGAARLPILAILTLAGSLIAQEKVTFQDHVLPIIENQCAKCHNPDKKKGDLDLSSYNGALKGGGSGAVVVSGNPDGSKLWKALIHAEEPTMPPNKPKLPDKELEVFKKWILSGLLETSGSKAIAASKPSVDLTLKSVARGKPDGPPPMPRDLPLEPVVHAARTYALTSLAGSPWAPLVAVAGQKEVLLYHSDSLELLGILPFAEGQPWDLKFSRSGKLLLAGGGRAAMSGRVVVWDVASGERLMTIGDDYDVALGADINPDQSQVALGGPGRLVKIFSTKTGELQHKIKKHTDWVTALAFSPSGEQLASADRNGGISVWDPDNGQELFTLPGHKSAVTSLSWRGDSKILASSSEDGAVKLWEMQEGKQAKTWNAHAGGALAVSYAHDGRLITCGRDNNVTLWDASGDKKRSFEFFGETPLRAAFSHDAGRVFATDFAGRVAAWNAADGKRLGELDANPVPLAARLAVAEKRVEEIQKRGNGPSPSLTVAEAELATVTAALETAAKALETAKAEQATRENEVARLKELAAKSSAPPDTDAKLLEARAARLKARAATTNATEVVETKTKTAAAARDKLTQAKAEDPQRALNEATAAVARLKTAQVQSSVYRVRESLAAKKREHENLLAAITASREAARQSEKDLAAAKDAAAKAKLKDQAKTLAAEVKKHEAAAKKLAAELTAERTQFEKMTAELERMKSASTGAVKQSKL